VIGGRSHRPSQAIHHGPRQFVDVQSPVFEEAQGDWVDASFGSHADYRPIRTATYSGEKFAEMPDHFGCRPR
jgi:hypothetical protein